MNQIGPGQNAGMGVGQGPAGLQPPTGPQQQQQQQQTQERFDHIARVKTLMWSVKDSLACLMKVAAQNLNRNVCIDLGLKTPDKVPRFDKQLEDFVTLCNQIELHLRTIQESNIQLRESHHYLNVSVIPTKPDGQLPPPGSLAPGEPLPLNYAEYLALIRQQTCYARDLQSIMFNELAGTGPQGPPGIQGVPTGPNAHPSSQVGPGAGHDQSEPMQTN